MNTINFANDFELFNNENLGSVRTFVDEHGNVWFIANDICNILNIANSRDALSRLDKDEKAAVDITDTSINGVKQRRNVNIINESGMYTLVLTSRKPQAKEFKRWITHEVIPSIREHGGYVYGQEKLTENERNVFKEELADMAAMVKKLRARRHELLGDVKKLKEEKRHLKKERKALNEYADIFEDLFEKAQSEYIEIIEENEALKNRIERIKNPEKFKEPEKGPKVFITTDGFIMSSEVWNSLNKENDYER